VGARDGGVVCRGGGCVGGGGLFVGGWFVSKNKKRKKGEACSGREGGLSLP
jgi:hypothetical protein